MNDEVPGVEWSESERRALAALPSEETPPPRVEDRVLSELAARGLVGRSAGRSRIPWLARAAKLALAAAAGAALFAAGLEAGRRGIVPASGPHPSRPAEPRFAIFLLDEPPGGAAEEPARVAEYKRWAAGLGAGLGRIVAGEKLGDAARLLLPAGESDGPAPERALRGYFVIEAPDLTRAVEAARTCPHLKRGGRILVRPIEPV